MANEDIQSWSTTALNNATADTGINWAEGMARADVNNSARAMMAAEAKQRNLTNGSITTTGSPNAQAFVSGVGYTAVPSGLRVLLKIGAALTNTATTTLNMDGIAPVIIQFPDGSPVTGGLAGGSYAEFVYNGTNWILLSTAPGTSLLASVTASAATSIVFTSGVDASFDMYEFDLINLKPSTANADLYCRISQDTGATFKAGATDYKYNYFLNSDIGTTGAVGSQGASQITLATSVYGGVHLYNATVRLVSPGTTGPVKTLMFDGWYLASGTNLLRQSGAGGFYGATFNLPINGIQFFFSAGTVATGKINMYGIRK